MTSRGPSVEELAANLSASFGVPSTPSTATNTASSSSSSSYQPVTPNVSTAQLLAEYIGANSAHKTNSATNSLAEILNHSRLTAATNALLNQSAAHQNQRHTISEEEIRQEFQRAAAVAAVTNNSNNQAFNNNATQQTPYKPESASL